LETVYGLYSNPESAQRAVSLLGDAGIEPAKISVVSSEPFDAYEFFHRDTKTAMPWLAALGGLLGGACGYLLTSMTQQAYPIPTGGMAIVALWPNGIITYEMTMLGAIVSTVVTLLVTARLPNWFNQLYDPAISDGKILIAVVNPSTQSRVQVESALRKAGAEDIRDFGRR
jgi:hypothetical protein